MLILATFFPDTNLNGSDGFDIIGVCIVMRKFWLQMFFPSIKVIIVLQEFLKCNVDLLDWVGLYVVLCGIPGRGHIKILTAGLGWAGAEILLTRFLLLWVGARGAEFDWKYIQKCLESNVNVVRLHHLNFRNPKSIS